MKKIQIFVLLTALFLPLFSACAEGSELLPIEKGTAVFTEIIDVTSVKASKDRSVFFQIMTKKNLATGETAYCAQLAYKKNSRRERTALLDIDEIDSALETLHYIQDNYTHLNDYSSIRYRSNATKFQSTDMNEVEDENPATQDNLETLLNNTTVTIYGQDVPLSDLVEQDQKSFFKDNSVFYMGIRFAGEKEKDLTLFMDLDTNDEANIPITSISSVINAFEETKAALQQKLNSANNN